MTDLRNIHFPFRIYTYVDRLLVIPESHKVSDRAGKSSGLRGNSLYYHLIKARATRQEVSLSESASKFWTDLSFLIQHYNSLAIEGAQKDYLNILMTGLETPILLVLLNSYV